MSEEKIKELLEFLGFKHSIDNELVYSKKYIKNKNYEISVDFINKKINYGKLIKLGDKTTSNFENSENFVVLECVDRLLEKGYKPESIHLEEKWDLGRKDKGKADIVVFDSSKKVLFIVECKTWGKEYEKELQRMQTNGGQLFSYLQQDRNAKYVCLYTSRLHFSKLTYQSAIVKISDPINSSNQEYNEAIKLYATARSKEELFKVWKERDNLYFHFNGIFEDDVQAYNIELKPLKKRNLISINKDDSSFIFNQLQEILRHNNISDKANAFNKTISLILCKIKDENSKNNDDILDFQYKEGVDTYESLLERLQSLFVDGMKEYLKEDILNHTDKEIDKWMDKVPAGSVKENLLKIIRELKYYTNNEFSFSEVHNKFLFEKNSKVLVEVVKLLQNYRFTTSHKEPFLGNLFELLLNSGYKQSSGQFFTTVVLARFIITCLPLRDIILEKLKNGDKNFIPDIMDFACGSGHFLTEVIDEITEILKDIYRDREFYNLDSRICSQLDYYLVTSEWTNEYVHGIEKDYRLARTSQVACFLNGSRGADIVHDDGLTYFPDISRLIKILIANPPYSINSFKQHLDVCEEDFKLLQYLTNDSKEIEVLFIERLTQIVDINGIVGIVLPSSILTNQGIFTKAREIMLSNFDIISIVELSSGAFMATGTNTVIMFMKRRDFNLTSDYIELANYKIIQNKTIEGHYINVEKLYNSYTQHIGINKEEYDKFLEREISVYLKQTDFYRTYKSWFDNLTEVKNLVKKKSFLEMDEKEKEKILNNLFFNKVLEVEKEKFSYFMMVQSQKVIIVNSPKNVKEEKEFLGYEFSNRRGHEGMEVLKDSKTGKPITKLFDAPVPKEEWEEDTPEEIRYHDKLNPAKINSYIYRAFKGEEIIDIHEEVRDYIKIQSLKDCIDFTKIDFDKQIMLKPIRKILIETSKWKQVKLADLSMMIKRGSSPKYGESDTQIIKSGKIRGYLEFDLSNKEYLDKSINAGNERLLQKGDILINSTGVGTAGRVNLFELDGKFVVDSHITIVRLDQKLALPKYVMYILAKFGFKNIEDMAQGQSGQIELNISTIENMKIPLPPIELQQQVVNKIEEYEKMELADIDRKTMYDKQLNNIISSINQGREKMKLGDICEVKSGGTPRKNISEYWLNGSIPWLLSEVCKGKIVNEANNFITDIGLNNSNAKMLNPNTTLIALVGATKGKTAYLTFSATTNQNIAGIYPKDIKVIDTKYLFYCCKGLYKEFEKLGKYKMANLDFIRKLEINVPDITTQKQIVEKLEDLENKINGLETNIELYKSKINKILDQILFE
ncbi:restriction endonuclease subunit S [Clostridium perfringens]|uniref:restriction endonuclease subunit S n=1 Tax=Clostridium perfringens TaxID=1502 RepID=UPI0018E4A133|nr:restriction endonuclease subunit S [Clostridium perfringens]MBI6015602.1 restriction endonuclease subunit S [Clostridium perfringens]